VGICVRGEDHSCSTLHAIIEGRLIGSCPASAGAARHQTHRTARQRAADLLDTRHRWLADSASRAEAVRICLPGEDHSCSTLHAIIEGRLIGSCPASAGAARHQTRRTARQRAADLLDTRHRWLADSASRVEAVRICLPGEDHPCSTLHAIIEGRLIGSCPASAGAARHQTHRTARQRAADLLDTRHRWLADSASRAEAVRICLPGEDHPCSTLHAIIEGRLIGSCPASAGAARQVISRLLR
jgi:hypothetical protein